MEHNAQRLFPRRLNLLKDLTDDVQTNELLLSKIGKFLTEVKVDADNDRIATVDETVKLIGKYCKRIEKIHLNGFVPVNLSVLPRKVKSISINFPQYSEPSKRFLNGFSCFKELESLTLKLERILEIDTNFLAELPPLRKLKLKNCALEPIDLRTCLENSRSSLASLSLKNCFNVFGKVLLSSIERLVRLNEFEFESGFGPPEFAPLSVIKRLTSLKLRLSPVAIDMDKLLNNLIDYNKIEKLSLVSIHCGTTLNRTTLQRSHLMTNLRRLYLCETDFVTDDFLMEITKCRTLTHFVYRQSYRPLLSLDAVLTFIELNGPKLEKCTYKLYHMVGDTNYSAKRNMQILKNYQTNIAFQRVKALDKYFSNQVTFVEFSF